MPSMAMFWRSVARRAYCGGCGHQRDAAADGVRPTSDVSLQRSHFESRGYFECPNCGSRGVYLRRGVGDDATRGALRVQHTKHEPDQPVPGSP